ncbi:hypothetical protein RRG08_066434 [Elysia crispata]|uniref:Uncharacterized protein n=1 Tax=Elysia crispata TaxID=231223 RepID=A0AAE0Z8B4_9GAST|nr:hypothetical protein RRG08_066434 [Elysia crispata]
MACLTYTLVYTGLILVHTGQRSVSDLIKIELVMVHTGQRSFLGLIEIVLVIVHTGQRSVSDLIKIELVMVHTGQSSFLGLIEIVLVIVHTGQRSVSDLIKIELVMVSARSYRDKVLMMHTGQRSRLGLMEIELDMVHTGKGHIRIGLVKVLFRAKDVTRRYSSRGKGQRIVDLPKLLPTSHWINVPVESSSRGFAQDGSNLALIKQCRQELNYLHCLLLAAESPPYLYQL